MIWRGQRKIVYYGIIRNDKNMRKPSNREINLKMMELRDERREPVTKTEKVFYTIFLVVILSWVVGGISNLFSK